MAKKDDIDWDDPEAVAAARGDNPDDTLNTDERDNPNRTDEEQAAIDAKAVEDEAAAKEAADKTKAEKAEDEAATKAEEEAAAKLAEEAKADEDKTDEEKAAEAKAAEDKAAEDKKEIVVPKSRLDAKTRQNKALQDQIAEYQRKAAVDDKAAKNDDVRTVIDGELAELDKAINKAIADDKMDEAAELRAEVRTKERELWKLDMDETGAEATNEAREQVRLDLAIDHIESTYDEFNPDAEGYSQEIVDKVQELRNGFAATGKYTQTQALLRAMDFVLPKKAVKDIEDAGDDPEAKAKKEEELRKAGLKKATDAANKQPAKTDGTGDDADSAGIIDGINVDKLSYEDIEALPEATKKRMRGDIPA